MRKIILVLLFFGVCSVAWSVSSGKIISDINKHAAYHPKKRQFINAGMVFDWEINRIYQVFTSPGRITDISLEPGEKLTSIAGGDTQRWTISESESGTGKSLTKHVFVKPHTINISSNLVFTTNRRVYHIELHAKKNIPYQAVISWNYPKSLVIVAKKSAIQNNNNSKPKTPLDNLSTKQLNFNYHFVAKKRPAWMPRRVFNDGHKTYIEFSESMQDKEAPGLWALSKSRQPEIVNYRRYKNFYIVDHLLDVAELSAGEDLHIKVGIEREDV